MSDRVRENNEPMTPSDLEKRLRDTAASKRMLRADEETAALLTEAANYIAQIGEELAEAKNPDVHTVVAYEAGYEDGKREAEAERDRLREALERIIYEIQVHEQEDGLPGVECPGAGFHLTKVGWRAAAALDQTGADK